MTRTQMVSAGQACIEVLVDGQGPAIVLVPSSQRDSRHEPEFVAHLGDCGFTVLRPQPRGMGRSTGPLDGISLFDLADDIAAAIDACGGGRAVVLGHAFGHTVARVADQRHPAKVRGVGLLAAAARAVPPELFALLDRAADAQDAPQARLAAMRLALFAPGSDPSAWMDGWYPALRAAYRQAGRTPPREQWWPHANAPILDLQGAEDPWRPPQTRDELKQVLGSKVTVAVVAGASHALLPERPLEVALAVAAWASGLPP